VVKETTISRDNLVFQPSIIDDFRRSICSLDLDVMYVYGVCLSRTTRDSFTGHLCIFPFFVQPFNTSFGEKEMFPPAESTRLCFVTLRQDSYGEPEFIYTQ